MSDRDYLYGHVCAHGSLALSCEMCDLEDFLDEVQEAWTRAEAENARLRAERAVMLDVIEAAEAALDRKSLHTEPCGCANCLLSDALARVCYLIGDDDE